MSFQDFESKPVTRQAHEVTAQDHIIPTTDGRFVITIDGRDYFFKANDAVKPGGFVVYINDADIYYCSREVFLERNHVDEAPKKTGLVP